MESLRKWWRFIVNIYHRAVQEYDGTWLQSRDNEIGQAMYGIKKLSGVLARNEHWRYCTSYWKGFSVQGRYSMEYYAHC